MITDSLMAKGCPIGSKFLFGGNEIEIYPDGSAHLTSTKGLAGSTLRAVSYTHLFRACRFYSVNHVRGRPIIFTAAALSYRLNHCYGFYLFKLY